MLLYINYEESWTRIFRSAIEGEIRNVWQAVGFFLENVDILEALGGRFDNVSDDTQFMSDIIPVPGWCFVLIDEDG